MESTSPGDLVTVDSGGPVLDGIVFDTPSAAKAVVAVVDRARGPILRTVDVKTLSERADEGADDQALRLLIRRTPPPVHAAARGAAAMGSGRAGHSRSTMHRTTGK